jgi:RNA polymerase sigma-70 factor (ECF subfamily)
VAGEDDADDVAQAALIAATRHLPGFDFRAGLQTWLYRIVRRCAADHHRRQKRTKRLADRQALQAAEPWHAPDVADLDARRAAAAVRRAFHRLPPRQRDVFDLVDLQGRGADEVAALLGLAPSTVRVHLLRARRTLRRIVLESEPACVEDRGGVQDRT